MKKSLTRRHTIQPVWIILGAALLIIAALLLVLIFLNPGAALQNEARSEPLSTAVAEAPTGQPSTDSPAESDATSDPAAGKTEESGPTTEPLAASVNGYTVTQSYMDQTARLNRVLGELSGAPVMDPEETLQRWISSELILQGAEEVDEPTVDEVESFISTLQRSWGVSDEKMAQKLQEAELDRAFLEETIARLLTVEASVRSLEDEGHSIAEWLSEQEQTAEIMVFEDAVGSEDDDISATPEDSAENEAPTPDAQSEVPDTAPDFTLARAGGGSFSLADQRKKGPVALVFFEKCG